MIILIREFGNHSNRLFQTLHFEAFCLENHLEFKSLALADMHNLFPATEARQRKVVYYFYKALKKARFINICIANNPDEIETYKKYLLQKKNVVVEGWGFRVIDLTTKYHDHFIERYTLKESHWHQHPAVMQYLELRAANPKKLFVAVHIRRGDYRTWMDGKYYFSDETYLAYMDQMEKIATTASGTTPYLLIFSDVKIELPRNKNYLLEQNDWYIDQYLMSKCDYIIGPPSTFSMWASYIGKTRYYHFTSQSDKFDLVDFKYCQ